MNETPTPVWDFPTRLFHWSLVILVLVAWITAGEQMAIHRAAGYALAGLLAFRLWWGLAGGSTARFTDFVRGGALSVLAILGMVGLQVLLGLFSIDEDGFEGGPLSDRIDFELAQQVAEWHELSFRILQGLIVLHLAAVAYYALKRREDIIRPMITGVRRFQGPVQGLVRAPLWKFLVGVLIAIAVGYAVSRGFRLG